MSLLGRRHAPRYRLVVKVLARSYPFSNARFCVSVV